MEEIISGGRIIRPAYKCVQDRHPYVSMGDRKNGSGFAGLGLR
jgi:citrate synthase